MRTSIINKLILFFGIFATQFYVFQSGVPQFSHMLLLLFIGLQLFKRNTSNFVINQNYEFFLLKIFTTYVIIVSLVFAVTYLNYSFLVFPVYQVYNVLLFFVVSSFLLSDFRHNYRILVASLIFGIFVLAFMHFLGFGRYDFGFRYNGFFNDPNQMGFWVLCSFSSIAFLIGKNKNILIFVFLLAVYISFVSGSRSVLIGLVFSTLGIVFKSFSLKGSNKLLYIAFLVFLIFVSYKVLPKLIENNTLVETYLNRIKDTRIEEQLEIRGYFLPLDFPEYLPFGAGMGLDSRFGRVAEVHSTWIGFLFYFGFIGIALFLAFIIRIFNRLSFTDKFIFLGPLFYGFSTFGARTPIFYIFLSVAFTKAYIIYQRRFILWKKATSKLV